MSHPPALPKHLVAVLGFLAMTGPLASDMYLASFTEISTDLQATASSVQLTFTAFLLGLGLGQLFLGPLSDRFGRRPILIASLIVFTLASIAIVAAPTIWWFIVLRLVQGLSGAAGIMLSRAIAADLTRGPATVRTLSLIAMLVGLGPIVAPPIGALVGSVFGWRGVLATLAILAALMLVLAWWLVPESLPKQNRHTGGVLSSLSHFVALLRDPQFVLIMISFAAAFAGMMAYIAASPFVGQIVLGMSPVAYAFAFSAGAVALITANLLNAWLASRVAPLRVMITGTMLSTVSSAVMLALVLSGTLNIPLFIVLAFTMISGVGFTMSNASALALGRASVARGSGAALIGASQFLFGGAVSPIVGAWGEHTATPMAFAMLTTALIGLTAGAVYMCLSKRAS